MSRHTLNYFRPNASRGSVFVLVISILAVMGLLAVTFSFSTRMELMASRNWSDKVQANMAAVTGLETEQQAEGASQAVAATEAAIGQQNNLATVSLQIKPSLKIDRLMVRSLDEQRSYQKADQLAARQYALTGGRDKNPEDLADFSIEDTSAKININAVLPIRNVVATGNFSAPSALTEETLARLIDDVLTANKIHNIDPPTLAHAIVAYRYGPDGRPGQGNVDDNGNAPMIGLTDNEFDTKRDRLKDSGGKYIVRLNRDRLDNDRDGTIDEPDESIESDGLDNDFNGRIDESGEGIDDPAEALIDIRQPPRGDDRPYVSLAQLINIKGMTPAAYQVLEPYLTVFSASHAAYQLPTAEVGSEEYEGLPQVDPNTATPEVIYETLKRRLPGTDTQVIGQFIANIIDRRDQDDLPSSLRLDSREYFGLEVTPYINEVCPDTSSFDDEGDDGQYIELFNPYGKDLSIDGWRIEGAETPIRLTGSLPSGGYLILTDDFNNENDTTPEWDTGQGSFFNIFNVMPTGGLKRLEEVSSLDLPNEDGQVRLLDDKGKLIDAFDWKQGTWTGAPLSFQRIDPRLRGSERVMATPLAPNASFKETEISKRTLEIQEKWQNKPFRSALDLMLTSSAYMTTADDQDPNNQTNAWALPVLRSENKFTLDIRLIDCFRVGTVVPDLENTQKIPSRPTDYSLTGAEASVVTNEAKDNTVSCATVHGRLNINSAPPVTLAALPGMTQSMVSAMNEARMTWFNPQNDPALYRQKKLTKQNAQYWMAVHPNAAPCWKNLSDFLLDDTIWQNRPLYDRLDAAYPFYRLLTTHSQSLRLLSANRGPAASDTETQDDTTRPTQTRAERILTSDRGSVETVTFRFLDRRDSLRGDPDLRYARVDSSAEKSYIDELKKLDPYLSGRVGGRSIKR